MTPLRPQLNVLSQTRTSSRFAILYDIRRQLEHRGDVTQIGWYNECIGFLGERTELCQILFGHSKLHGIESTRLADSGGRSFL